MKLFSGTSIRPLSLALAFAFCILVLPAAFAMPTQSLSSSIAEAKVEGPRLLVQRKLRVERLLMALDRIASVTIQMRPENAERLEPVIVDLAEQTLELVREDAIVNVRTDAELDRLENTVGELASALGRMVEPEATL